MEEASGRASERGAQLIIVVCHRTSCPSAARRPSSGAHRSQPAGHLFAGRAADQLVAAVDYCLRRPEWKEAKLMEPNGGGRLAFINYRRPRVCAARSLAAKFPPQLRRAAWPGRQ